MGSIRRAPRNLSRWEARYRDLSGKQRTKTFDSRSSAKAWLASNETLMQTGAWIDPRFQSIKISKVASEWLSSDHRKRDGSVARDNSILTNHILPEIGGRAIGGISRSNVQALVDKWSLNSAPSTVQRQYACLRGLFSFA